MAYQYLVDSGVIVVDTTTLLTDTENEYKAQFGADMNTDPSTPQGLLIASDTSVRKEVLNEDAALANQINPNIAGGVFLRAIGALTGLDPAAATKSTITAVALTGIPNTIIPQGSRAQTAIGDIFESTGAVVLSLSGTATVDFQSIVTGAIPASANTLTTINSSVLGWETVNNPNAAILGTDNESDYSFRKKRKNTLALQGVALVDAITSALYAVPGVTSLQFRENYNSVPMGMLIHVTNGATLSNTNWNLATTGNIVVDTTDVSFIAATQSLPTINPWPVAKYTTTGNVTLSGLSTQGGGDWGGALTAGDIILAKNQTDLEENMLWVAASGAWTRQSYNTSGSTILGSNDGISLVKNSIWACVKGGTDTDVANALLNNKSNGCAYNGATTVNVIEPSSGQTYAVTFDRPIDVPFQIRATVHATLNAGNATTLVQNAILDYANGNFPYNDGFVVGANVSPFEISAAVSYFVPGIFVVKMEVSTIAANTYQTTQWDLALNDQASINIGNITVVLV